MSENEAIIAEIGATVQEVVDERDKWRERAERAEAALAAVEALADWYDAEPNWREWRIGASIRVAIAQPETEDA